MPLCDSMDIGTEGSIIDVVARKMAHLKETHSQSWGAQDSSFHMQPLLIMRMKLN